MNRRKQLINRLKEKARVRTILRGDQSEHEIIEYDIGELATVPGLEEDDSKKKVAPKIKHNLRTRTIIVPEVINQATGITILEKNIKSIIFTTDVAIIQNSNAEAVMAVYPFTPQLSITQAILNTSSVPVFVGIGGGLTSGARSLAIGLQAELYGAYGVVVNSPMASETIDEISNELDIPLIATIASDKVDYISKINAGAQILNVSAGAKTVELVKKIRSEIGYEFPIIATGGPNEESILKTIEAGANAITYSPPSTGEIFASIMEDYRKIES